MHSAASLAWFDPKKIVSDCLVMCLLFMGSTYPAVASRAQIFPAGDGAFLQRWDGAGDGSEANDGGDNGCEVDHFVCGEGIFLVAAKTWRGCGR